MATPLTRILIHLLITTRDRADSITPALEPGLYAHLAEACRHVSSPLLASGGTSNHIHLLIDLSEKYTLQDVVARLKSSSAKWAASRPEPVPLAWQESFGAFSISNSQVAQLRAYLSKQREHHAASSLDEELLMLVTNYGVSYLPQQLYE